MKPFGEYHVHLWSLGLHCSHQSFVDFLFPLLLSLPFWPLFLSLSLAPEAPRYKLSLTNQTVNVTESLRMECDVEGRPLPRLSWFKDNQPLHQMSGTPTWVMHTFTQQCSRPPANPHMHAHTLTQLLIKFAPLDLNLAGLLSQGYYIPASQNNKLC